jgi:hypothetical protein
MPDGRSRQVLLVAFAAVVLGVASTLTLAAAIPANPNKPFADAPVHCDVPALPGTVVDVTLADMPGTMMGHGMMGLDWPDRAAPGTPGHGYPRMPMSMMRVLINPPAVPSGQASFRVVNTGAWVHELVVLPLAPGEDVGRRPIGADNEVDESAALGIAARTCDTGDGDGIIPGGIGWATMTLAPGRYELICNFGGHYWAGMYTELTVTAPAEDH